MENNDKFIQLDEADMRPVYIAFREHLGQGIPNKNCYQKALHELVDGYEGPDVYFDFNDDGRLIGIDISSD